MLRLFVLLAALAPVSAAAGAHGAELPDQVAAVEVLPGWQDGATRVAALRIRLAPGWKTYWRAPGDAGIPPVFDWRGSSNLGAVSYRWPVPHVFELNGLRSIGYRDELVLPLLLTPGRAGQPIRLKGTIDLGVCQDVCVPVSLQVDAELSPGGARDPRIVAALADRPRSAGEAGVAGLACEVAPIRDGLRLTARMSLPPVGSDEVVVVETGTPDVWVSEADTQRQGRTLTAAADLVPPSAAPFALDRSALRITVIGDDRAVDIIGCPAG